MKNLLGKLRESLHEELDEVKSSGNIESVDIDKLAMKVAADLVTNKDKQKKGP